MRIGFRLLMGALTLAAIAVAGILFKFNLKVSAQYEKPQVSIHDEVLKANIELGKRLYSVRSGCIDCHGANMAGKLVMDNPPMGTITGANITSFTLKDWTDEDIAVAIRYGIHKSGRSLNFMPSFDYEGLSKGDVAAIIAYMRSVPEVTTPSKINSFGPIAKLLGVAGKMPVLFPAENVDPKKGFADKPEEGPTPEFGKYLAGACIGCHGADFKGGPIAGGDPSWPPAANIRLGAKKWSETEFTQAIKTGKSPVNAADLRPPMPVELLKQMNDMEVKALWNFLSTLN